MGAYELALGNFAVAEQLVQLYQLFSGLHELEPEADLRLVVCRRLGLAENAAIRHVENEHLLVCARAAAPIPPGLVIEGGIDFLLRQSIIVACTALESFFWDSLRENVLIVVKARRRGADRSIRDITLTLDDYLSIETFADPDERLRQIILRNFERGALYDSASMEKIASVLTVAGFWDEVGNRCGRSPGDLRRDLDELIARRNQIAHRADRPNMEAHPPEEVDGHGLRRVNTAWVTPRIASAKAVVDAANQCFFETIRRLETQIASEQERALARQTLSSPSRDDR